MKTDTSEKGLEALIVAQMTGMPAAVPKAPGMEEGPEPFVGLHNWILGNPQEYDRAFTVDIAKLRAFLAATQEHLVNAFDLDHDSPTRQKFLARVQGEIGKRGVIDVLRKGIKDVLKSYTPVESYYRLIKTIESDPEFDTKRAKKKLRRYVESNDHAIRLKAEIMVDHFHEQVVALKKIGGQARAMVVTSGIERAIQYFHAIRDYLKERKSPHQAIVAFSGEYDYGGVSVTESSLNGFPSKDIPDRIAEDPYRFLICADKFQTGYDEPLMYTM
jgi:type I site-specific restriction-modification system R (restriction) subunit